MLHTMVLNQCFGFCRLVAGQQESLQRFAKPYAVRLRQKC